MATIGSLIVNLVANTSQFTNGMKKGVRETKDFESRIKSVHATFGKFTTALGIAGVGISVGGFLKQSYQEAAEAERIYKQLETVVSSTGQAAGFSARQLDELSKSLQRSTTYSDESVKSAQSLLLTFTNIKGNVFKDATSTILDVSTALGQSLKSSAIQLGKALNDPIRGVSALSDVGVSFTEKQREQIRVLVQSGKVMDAQRIILNELATEFGGSASSAVDTMSGKVAQLSNQWRDLKQHVGETLALPVAEWAIDSASDLGDLGISLKDVADAATRNLRLSFKAFAFGSAAVRGFIKDLAGVPLGLKDTTPALEKFRLNWEAIAKAAGKAGAAISSVDKDKIRRFGRSLNNLIGGAVFPTNATGERLYGDPTLARRKRIEEERAKRLEKFGSQLNNLYGALFIGRNRANVLGRDTPASRGNAQISSPLAGYRPTAALDKGSAEAYSAILRSRGTVDGLTNLAKRQLSTQERIARTADKIASAGTAQTVAIGAA